MGLVKRRPRIELLAPRVLPVGAPFELRAVLECDEAITVRSVDIDVVALGAWSDDVGLVSTGTLSARNRIARLVAQPLASRRDLTPGRVELAARFELPQDAPGSYAGRHLRIDWLARVHVRIPWWLDARRSFDVVVAGAGTTHPEPPKVFASDPGGPRGKSPYAELSLASSTVEPGGVVAARLALANTEYNRYRRARITLVAEETMKRWGLPPMRAQHRARQWTVDLDHAEENRPIAFKVQLPARLTPAFAWPSLSMRWGLEVELDVAWSRDLVLWIPLTIRTTRGEREGELVAPPPVGSDRIAAVWKTAAQRAGWDYEDRALAKQVDAGGRQASLRVVREHTGRRGLRLVAEVMVPALRLGLRVEGGRLLARDPGHARQLADNVDDRMAVAGLAEADEETLRFVRIDPGTRVGPLADFAAAVHTAVETLLEIRAELPPPEAVASHRARMQGVARRVGAMLDVPSLSVEGTRDEVPFTMSLAWKGDQPDALELAVRPLIPIDRRYRGQWGQGAPPPDVPVGADALLDRADGIAIDAHSVTVRLPLRWDDLDDAVEALEALIGLGRALSMRGEGYR